MSRSLANQKIKDSYPFLLQKRDGVVLDGDGNVINLEGRDVYTTHTSGSLDSLSAYWFADTSSGSVSAILNPLGDKVFIRDLVGSASVNNIIVYAPDGQTINGNSSEAIDVDFGWVEYFRTGTEWFTLAGQAYIPVVPSAAQIGAYPLTNPDGYMPWSITSDDTGELTGVNIVWLADSSEPRNRTHDPTGTRVVVKDVTGNASINNVIITAPEGQTINGNASEGIDIDFGWVEYYRVGSDWITLAGQSYIPSGFVGSVTGDGVDNTDPTNPVLTFPTPTDIGAIETDTSGSGEVLAIWKGTQAEYDAIVSPSLSTLYVITA